MSVNEITPDMERRMMRGETIPICKTCQKLITTLRQHRKNGNYYKCPNCQTEMRLGNIVTDCSEFGLVTQKTCMSCDIGKGHIAKKQMCPKVKGMKWRPQGSIDPNKYSMSIEEFNKSQQ